MMEQPGVVLIPQHVHNIIFNGKVKFCFSRIINQNIKIMKNIFTYILLTAFGFSSAQVIIGDASGTATNKSSVLLEFKANDNKGIIVPYVRALPTGAALVGGTIILDARSTSLGGPVTSARVKFYDAKNSVWVDLSGQDANLTSPTDYMSSQPTVLQAPESTTSKAIIGARSSAADGVLVLESTTKAMVLPIVDDVQNILSPSPGMMVYVKGVTPTFKKRLAVFNGSKWSFWKP